MAKAQPAHYYKGRRMKRLPAGTCITKEAWDKVNSTARLFNVSRSWVIAFVVSSAFKIDVPSFTESRRNAR